MKPINSLLIKPSGPDCNLNCGYCFYLPTASMYATSKTHQMTDEVLENLIQQAMNYSTNSISLAWQGGEPTLMGLDFYKKVIDLETKYGRGKAVSNALQTNGTLLTEEWMGFLKKYQWLVGLSLDGPQHIHDRYRISLGNKPTWEIVSKAAKMMQKAEVDFNALCCVTDYSADFAEELWEYYKSIGISYLQFIPIVEPDPENPSVAASFSVTAEKYGKFLCKIFDLWVNDFENGKPKVYVRDIESIFYNYVGFESPTCVYTKECGNYLVVEHNGDIFSCDHFVNAKWKLGNLKTGDLSTFINSKKMSDFGKIKAQLPNKCRLCSWLKYCYGGCTKDRVKDSRDSNMPRFCKSYIMFYNHADPFLKNLANQWKVQQKEADFAQSTNGNFLAFK